MEDSKWKGMRRFLFWSPSHDPLRCEYRENPTKHLGTSQLPSFKLSFGAILKCTTQCWKSCGADNLEQMTDNFGTTWVENVNQVNLCISATWRQTSASSFADFARNKIVHRWGSISSLWNNIYKSLVGRVCFSFFDVFCISSYIHQNLLNTLVNVVDYGRQFLAFSRKEHNFHWLFKHFRKCDQLQPIWGVFDNLISFAGRRLPFLFPSPWSKT